MILKYFEAYPIDQKEAFKLLKDRLEENCDDCRNDCTLQFCGDGITDCGEECDGEWYWLEIAGDRAPFLP